MSERMNCVENNSNSHLFTQDVLNAVRPYAEKLAKQTRGGLEAEDLIQTAVLTLMRRKQVAVDDMAGLLTFRIRCAYLEWVHGTNYNPDKEPVPFSAPQDRYMATGSLPVHDGVKTLTVSNPVESWELSLDIEHAVQQLSIKEQQLVKLKVLDELSEEEIGERLNMHRSTVRRHWASIQKKLQVLLAEHE